MHFQVRHLLLWMALTALAVQWAALGLSLGTFRGEIRGMDDLPPWRWLLCALCIAAIFLQRPRGVVRIAALVVLVVGLYFDRGTFTSFGWASIVLGCAAIGWLLLPLATPRLRGDTVVAAMIPLTMALVFVLVIDTMDRPYLSDSLRLRVEFLEHALQGYRRAHGAYPPRYVLNAQGERMHCWRALLLPYLASPNQQYPFQQYRYHEPWNSYANRQLADRTPWEFSPEIWGRTTVGRCNCFAAVGGLRDSLRSQQRAGPEPTSNTITSVILGSTTIPHWNEPVECEFYRDGSVIAPKSDWLRTQREEYLVQLNLDTAPPVAKSWLAETAGRLFTSGWDDRIRIFDCPQLVRHWGGAAAFKPPRPAYGILWVGLAAYVLLDVVISFAVAGAARRRSESPSFQRPPEYRPLEGFIRTSEEESPLADFSTSA